MSSESSATVGLTVLHRRYVPFSHAHYAGNLVDGAYSLAAFGDVATEMCIRADGDEVSACRGPTRRGCG
jgi:3-aminobutyryl-CoA ammonia-lyase